MHYERQLRLRVLEALELSAKQFRTREELFPIRIPREPSGSTNSSSAPSATTAQRSIRPRCARAPCFASSGTMGARGTRGSSCCHLSCGSSATTWRGMKNARARLRRAKRRRRNRPAVPHPPLGIGGRDLRHRDGGRRSDRVRSSIADRAFLVDVFVNLFEVRAMEAAIAPTSRSGAIAGDGTTAG